MVSKVFNKILIIGCNGFIGSHLVEQYKSASHRVIGCDVCDSHSVDKYYIVDQLNPDYNQIFLENKFDLVINASGSSNVNASFINPFYDYNLNVQNAIKILETIRLFNSECKYINLSSAAVYGNPKVLPINEMAEISPQSPYANHKYLSELVCKEYSMYYGLNTCNIRIFSAYGPGLKKQIFWDLYQKYKNIRKDHIELWGTGKESRDFIYIKDLVSAIHLCSLNSNFTGEIINIASGKEIFIKDAAETLIRFLDPTVKIIFNGLTRKGDPINWNADIKQLRSFGFDPGYTLETGLKKYADWLRDEIKS